MTATLQQQGQTRPLRDRHSLLIRQKLLIAVQRQTQERQTQSLHQSVLATLGSQQESETTKYPCNLNVKISGRRTVALSPDESFSQLLAQHSGTWTILGEPGAGKTTLLLELAFFLLARAQTDSSQPIPLLLDLATWQTQDKLVPWLLAQSIKTYQLPSTYTQQWLERGELILLLDGLDELQLAQQEECLKAINDLLNTYPQLPNLILCTRLDDYRSCQTKLQLKGAVLLQPLSYAQIQDYLMKSRSRELWQNIKKDSHLLALGNTPLLLSIMALSYEEILIHSWKRIETPLEQYHYLLNAFVRRMLTNGIEQPWYRSGKEPRPEVARYWLSVLADQMQRENVKQFCPEQLQPSWLSSPGQVLLYRLGVGFGVGLICALVVGLAIATVAGVKNGLIIGAIGAGLGLAAGLTQKIDRIELPQLERSPRSTIWESIFRIPGSAFLFGLIVGPALGLILGIALRYSLWVGGIWTVIFGGLFGLLWLAVQAVVPDIDSSRKPNQGIRQAWIIASAIAPLASLIVALLCGVGLGLITEPSFGLIVGLISGLVIWFLLAIESLVASVQHFVLRTLLAAQKKLPWNYTRFLNYATSCHLLQRVNGRYQFIHELIQAHFAQTN